jgi:hypothetical protein
MSWQTSQTEEEAIIVSPSRNKARKGRKKNEKDEEIEEKMKT